MEESRSASDTNQLLRDIYRAIRNHWRMSLAATAVVTGIVAVIAGAYLLWGQPTLRTLVLEFRPTFRGADSGHYPNDLPFGPSDITATAVLDSVYQRSGIDQYCSASEFRSGLFVEQHGAELRFLDAEYQARLSDPRLTAVERDRVQTEYRARRAALPVQYRLVFAVPAGCKSLPSTLASKVLYETLGEWARQSEEQRGVLRLHVPLLTPGMLDVDFREGSSLMIQADLVRTRLARLIANIAQVETNAGAAQIRLTEGGVTMAEVRTKLEDLVKARLEPLVVAIGRSIGASPTGWAEEALSSARREQAAAEGKAGAYLAALREYSGQPQAGPVETRGATTPGEVQTLAPQIDRTFIDRILEMSQANTAFRQRLTEEMVKADVGAMESRAKTAYYEHLVDALRRPGAGTSVPEVEARLREIVQESKMLAQQFLALSDQFAKHSLRVGPAIYEVQAPVQVATYRPFTPRAFLAVMFVTLLLTILLAIGFFTARNRIRALAG